MEGGRRATQLTAEREVQDLEFAANLPVGFLFDENHKLRPVRELPLAVQRAIQSVEEIEVTLPGGTVKRRYKLRLIDKARMHELLCKHLRIGEPTSVDRENLPATFLMPPGTHVRIM